MTERFMVDDCGTLIDMYTRDTFDYVSDVCSLLNELHEENKELQDTIKTICKDFEESHGMDIRNADWFTAW